MAERASVDPAQEQDEGRQQTDRGTPGANLHADDDRPLVVDPFRVEPEPDHDS